MQHLVSRPSSEIDDVVVINFIGDDSGGRQQIMTSTNEDISLSLLYYILHLHLVILLDRKYSLWQSTVSAVRIVNSQAPVDAVFNKKENGGKVFIKQRNRHHLLCPILH